MKKFSKTDSAKLDQLRPIAQRYSVQSQRAATYFKNTGTPMFQPGALTEAKKASKAASAEIQTIVAKYR